MVDVCCCLINVVGCGLMMVVGCCFRRSVVCRVLSMY